jgi:hypothetical protein
MIGAMVLSRAVNNGCTPAFMSGFSGAFELWSSFSLGFFDMELSSLRVPG